jgi:pyruvate formate lyase activating enzyme
MRFGALLPNSLIDFPGRISCVLFVTGCNFTCPYCHNPDLASGALDPQRSLSETAFFDFLQRRSSLLDGVVISGGEPTLLPELFELCRAIQAMGYAVKLDTNGSRPEVLKRLIRERLVDFVAMDIKTRPSRYAPLIRKTRRCEDLVESIDTILQSRIPHEFRTTCVAPLVTEETIRRIALRIHGANRYVLQRCRGGRVLDPAFFESTGRALEESEMDRLQNLAAPWVEECIVR